jgi:hypothetical protein
LKKADRKLSRGNKKKMGNPRKQKKNAVKKENYEGYVAQPYKYY